MQVLADGRAQTVCSMIGAVSGPQPQTYRQQSYRFTIPAEAVKAADGQVARMRFMRNAEDGVLIRTALCVIPRSEQAVNFMLGMFKNGVISRPDPNSNCRWSDGMNEVACVETYLPICPENTKYDPTKGYCMPRQEARRSRPDLSRHLDIVGRLRYGKTGGGRHVG